MKLKMKKKNAVAGSVLLVTLATCVILGVLMGSYLSMIKSQHFSVARGQAWNSALVVAEAGVEEAMAHLNDTNLPANHQSVLTAQGFWVNKWAPPNATHSGYWKTNLLTDGTRTNGYYDATIIIANPNNPVIVSTGYVNGPLSSPVLQRAVRVATQPITRSTPGGAMVVTDTVDFKGAGVTTDSFQSTNLVLFPGGIYNATNALDHGDVSSTSKLTNMVNIGNATIKGSVHTSPNGNVQIGAQGVVGDKAFVNNSYNAGKIEANHQLHDAA